MPATPEQLFAFLADHGIQVTTFEHPALHTVAESQELRGQIAGAHTKNLFLKDKKDNFFLLTVEETASVDLKTIHHVIGAAGKVSFGKPEALMELLGVVPGSVSIMGLINDTGHRVTPFIAADLLQSEVVNVHPLVNTATTSIKSDDLLQFVKATGHEAQVLKL
ncbi:MULTISPECIES: prolyl-tRNA synthetase associated domain-containing protein [Mesorhizobium]|uniref:Prolyl-tRNA synthetase associated domain-containing protein n=1 Tax=Mesorhizobium denitrificans TaxID=2294114 RepID=A0A371XGW4_9HYPH|nr:MULTISPECIES: YbaK/EbsC family protein [Mesorhizobium]RFC68461.1 prolyl-tRNA synthetase associated domain-containing protein [Mesorhizobium denitrificans]